MGASVGGSVGASVGAADSLGGGQETGRGRRVERGPRRRTRVDGLRRALARSPAASPPRSGPHDRPYGLNTPVVEVRRRACPRARRRRPAPRRARASQPWSAAIQRRCSFSNPAVVEDRLAAARVRGHGAVGAVPGRNSSSTALPRGRREARSTGRPPPSPARRVAEAVDAPALGRSSRKPCHTYVETSIENSGPSGVLTSELLELPFHAPTARAYSPSLRSALVGRGDVAVGVEVAGVVVGAGLERRGPALAAVGDRELAPERVLPGVRVAGQDVGRRCRPRPGRATSAGFGRWLSSIRRSPVAVGDGQEGRLLGEPRRVRRATP